MSTILTSKQLSIALKVRVLGCYVFSVFSYGSEAWTLTKPMEEKINAFEMWCLRRMGGVSWKDRKTNDEILLNDENRKKPFENHKTTKTSILWTCEKAERVPQNGNGGQDGGEET